MPSPVEEIEDTDFPVQSQVLCTFPSSEYYGQQGRVTGAVRKDGRIRVNVRWGQTGSTLGYLKKNIMHVPRPVREFRTSRRVEGSTRRITIHQIPPSVGQNPLTVRIND